MHVREVGHRGQVVDHVGRVGAAQHGVEEEAVLEPVHAPGGIDVGRRLARWHHVVEVGRDADVGRAPGAQRVDGETVREQRVVGGVHGGDVVLAAGCVHAGGVAEKRHAPRLVDRDPAAHPVAERVVDERGVLGQAVGGLALRPAARVLEHLRQVPVVQRRPRLDAAFQQPVDEAVVERDAARVERAAAGGLHPWPGDREAVGVDAQPLQQVEVLARAVVVVARDVAAVSLDDAAVAAERVPDRRRPAVEVRRALDLVRGGRHAPDEVRGEHPRMRRIPHPLTAPSMMPAMSCLPATKNSTSSGTVASAVPASTSE